MRQIDRIQAGKVSPVDLRFELCTIKMQVTEDYEKYLAREQH